MAAQWSTDELVARLIRAGELEVSGEAPDEAATYFNAAFRFHGPGGTESDLQGLFDYFASIRDAFDDRSIRRGIIVAQGLHVACQTYIEGTFVRPFTQSPVGLLEPNGNRVTWDLINVFEFDDEGRLLNEYVQTDNRTFLSQLGSDE